MQMLAHPFLNSKIDDNYDTTLLFTQFSKTNSQVDTVQFCMKYKNFRSVTVAV